MPVVECRIHQPFCQHHWQTVRSGIHMHHPEHRFRDCSSWKSILSRCARTFAITSFLCSAVLPSLVLFKSISSNRWSKSSSLSVPIVLFWMLYQDFLYVFNNEVALIFAIAIATFCYLFETVLMVSENTQVFPVILLLWLQGIPDPALRLLIFPR